MNKFLVKHPIITEKATDLSHLGKYVFLVDDEASSPEIKKIIEETRERRHERFGKERPLPPERQ